MRVKEGEREKDGSRLAAKEKRKERSVTRRKSAVFVKNLFGSASWKISPRTPRFSLFRVTLPTVFVPSIFPLFFFFTYLTCSDLFLSLSRDLFLCHLYFLFFALIRALPCVDRAIRYSFFNVRIVKLLDMWQIEQFRVSRLL